VTSNGTGGVRVTAHLMAPHRIDAEVEKIVGRISLEPTITAARWEAEAHLDAESRSALGH
jgi:putative Mg2+ transporter-C (MgtC) family protein